MSKTKKELLDTLEEVINDLRQAESELLIIRDICDGCGGIYEMEDEERIARMQHIYNACNRNWDYFGSAVIKYREYLDDARGEVSE